MSIMRFAGRGIIFPVNGHSRVSQFNFIFDSGQKFVPKISRRSNFQQIFHSTLRAVSSNVSHLECEHQNDSEDRRKKKVALWIGYAGMRYRGLQFQPDDIEKPATIEGELLRAIFKSGGMLESNYGSQQKVGWSRSSRTDKGVHSIATIVSFNMEIPRDTWTSVEDREGTSIAHQINEHLPDDIRVFSALPAARSFSARKFCKSRSYHYFVPAPLLNLDGNSSLADIDKQTSAFRDILHHFEGRHPFHNYTVRRLYRPSTLEKMKRKKGRHGRAMASNNDEAESNSDSEEESPPDEPTSSSNNMPTKSLAWWLHSPNADDRIGSSHFRHMYSFTCGGMEVHCGVPVVRVMVHGDSFMLHQIRKMVGTALAVFMGKLSVDVMKASLIRHARVALPIAPPDGLVLHSCEFYPFRGGLQPNSVHLPQFEGASTERVVKLSRERGAEANQFLDEQILPHIVRRMHVGEEPWAQWVPCLESLIPREEVEKLVWEWRAWMDGRADREDSDGEDSLRP